MNKYEPDFDLICHFIREAFDLNGAIHISVTPADRGSVTARWAGQEDSDV